MDKFIEARRQFPITRQMIYLDSVQNVFLPTCVVAGLIKAAG